jgi:hypothetical protein
MDNLNVNGTATTRGVKRGYDQYTHKPQTLVKKTQRKGEVNQLIQISWEMIAKFYNFNCSMYCEYR